MAHFRFPVEMIVFNLSVHVRTFGIYKKVSRCHYQMATMRKGDNHEISAMGGRTGFCFVEDPCWQVQWHLCDPCWSQLINNNGKNEQHTNSWDRTFFTLVKFFPLLVCTDLLHEEALKLLLCSILYAISFVPFRRLF